MRPRSLQIGVALLLAGLWGAFLGHQHLAGNLWFLDRVEATMTDLRTLIRGSRPSPQSVAIVAIDDETIRQVGSYPIPRSALAQLVRRLQNLGPRAIAIDLLLVDAGPPADDEALANALAESPSVIAAAAVYAQGRQFIDDDEEDPLARLPVADRLLTPLPRFADVAAVGVVNVTTDNSGTPRAFPLFFRTPQGIEPALPLRALTVATGQDPIVGDGAVAIDGRIIRTDIGYILPLNFFGPRGTVETVSAAAILGGTFSDTAVRDRIVVIGATVTGGGDVFPTPFDSVLPGVEVIATAIAHLSTGDGLVRDHRVRIIDAATAVALPMVLIGLLGWRRSAIGFAAMLGVLVAWLGINQFAFARGIWLSIAVPMAAAGPPVLLFGLAQIWRDRLRARHFAGHANLLRRFQAARLVAHMESHPDFLAEPVRQNAAILFIDLSGFTGLSEMLGPTVVRDLLNSFYARVEAAALAGDGIITGFAGDGVMIVFGLPAVSEKDAANAAQCGVRLAEETGPWIAGLPPSIGSRISFKIGAHYGPVVASRLGGGAQQQITATGDTVNVASRLMEIAAANKAEFALSNELLAVAGQTSAPRVSGQLDGPVETQVRGRSGSLSIWLWRRGRVAAEP